MFLLSWRVSLGYPEGLHGFFEAVEFALQGQRAGRVECSAEVTGITLGLWMQKGKQLYVSVVFLLQ